MTLITMDWNAITMGWNVVIMDWNTLPLVVMYIWRYLILYGLKYRWIYG